MGRREREWASGRARGVADRPRQTVHCLMGAFNSWRCQLTRQLAPPAHLPARRCWSMQRSVGHSCAPQGTHLAGPPIGCAAKSGRRGKQVAATCALEENTRQGTAACRMLSKLCTSYSHHAQQHTHTAKHPAPACLVREEVHGQGEEARKESLTVADSARAPRPATSLPRPLPL